MEKGKITIVVTDDHKLFRKGIHALLEDFSFTGDIYEAGNGKDLLELLKQLQSPPDIILLDIQMPVMDGMEAHKKIRELYPQQKVIVLTMEDDEHFMLHMIAEGVNGYLLKNAEPDELEAALKKVMKNDYYFPSNMSQLVLKSAQKRSLAFERMPEFSVREIEVLELICQEYTASEIAEKLELSVRTIEGYRRNLLEKSGSRNVAGLIVFALKNKLVFL